MVKINFSKVEDALVASLRRSFIHDLYEMAGIATLQKQEGKKLPSEEVKKLILRFQKELKKIKLKDPTFFSQLELSDDDEKNLLAEYPELETKDWTLIQALYEKMESWRKSLRGNSAEMQENDVKYVEKIRKKQKDARFNVNPKWTPL